MPTNYESPSYPNPSIIILLHLPVSSTSRLNTALDTSCWNTLIVWFSLRVRNQISLRFRIGIKLRFRIFLFSCLCRNRKDRRFEMWNKNVHETFTQHEIHWNRIPWISEFSRATHFRNKNLKHPWAITTENLRRIKSRNCRQVGHVRNLWPTNSISGGWNHPTKLADTRILCLWHLLCGKFAADYSQLTMEHWHSGINL
jgi:hypothetical protein